MYVGTLCLGILVPVIVFGTTYSFWLVARSKSQENGGNESFFNTLERFKVCRRRRRRPSSVPIKFPRKYISNDYYILVFTLSR
jgi:hypothetical protein